MMNRVFRWLRDASRGYTDIDVLSLQAKLMAPRLPGEVIPLSSGEHSAMLDGRANWTALRSDDSAKEGA
jgi:hypothetical protein